jgi:hypothetical protein
LRLYGVLNAIYIQQESILTLYEKFQVEEIKEARRNFNDLAIMDVRHKIGAHSNNYTADYSSKKLESFVPVRAFLEGFKCDFQNVSTGVSVTECDLKKLLNVYLDVAIKTYDKMYEKSIKTVYKCNDEKIDYYMEKLDILRKKHNGDIIIEGKDGSPGLHIKIS